MKFLLTALICLFLTSCDEDVKHEKNHAHHHDGNHQHHEEVHSHIAPNGGTLTELDGHNASLEWLIEDNQLKIYIFDGCAEKPIRIAQQEIKVSVEGLEQKQLILAPLSNKLTGEKPGDANTFISDAKDLKQDNISAISVHSVKIKGIDYKNVNLKVK